MGKQSGRTCLNTSSLLKEGDSLSLPVPPSKSLFTLLALAHTDLQARTMSFRSELAAHGTKLGRAALQLALDE